MKVIIFQLVLTLLILDTYAQKVSNIRAEQRGQDIVVLYSLETTSPCEVSLLLSQDNGATWSDPLKKVFGDVGKNISGGEKQITWKVLGEQEYLVGDKMKFKVIANGRKSFEPEMVFVEGGVFKMGKNYGLSEEPIPLHSVTLSSFNISKYEITQAQWQVVMGNNPSYFSECMDCPVESVSWNDVQDFVLKLNFQTGKKYRLPTEAEWEFAAKGGNSSKGFAYSGSDDLNSIAWYAGNSAKKTHVVGTKKTNELGIYDMTGNVMEWCSDWYEKYSIQNETNPTGAAFGQKRVIRGGSCNQTAWDLKWGGVAGGQYFAFPENGNPYCGFRLVLPND